MQLELPEEKELRTPLASFDVSDLASHDASSSVWCYNLLQITA